MSKTTHKCGVSGCKAQTGKRDPICARHSAMLPAALAAQLLELWQLLNTKDSLEKVLAARDAYTNCLARATAICRRREQAPDLFGGG